MINKIILAISTFFFAIFLVILFVEIYYRSKAEKYLKVTNDSFFWKEPEAQRGKTYRYKSLGFRFTGDDEHCHFLIDNKCSVHVVRPFQCRSFPFWQMMVSSKKNFDNYTKKCKGLQLLKGKFYTREDILKWAQDEYEIEKKYFLEMKKHNFNILKGKPQRASSPKPNIIGKSVKTKNATAIASKTGSNSIFRYLTHPP